MKDPNDKETLDFAEIAERFERDNKLKPGTLSRTPKALSEIADMYATALGHTPKKRGRKPIGNAAMTPAEKQKAYRDRQRAAGKQTMAQRVAELEKKLEALSKDGE